jgi:hypothetical protein
MAIFFQGDAADAAWRHIKRETTWEVAAPRNEVAQVQRVEFFQQLNHIQSIKFFATGRQDSLDVNRLSIVACAEKSEQRPIRFCNQFSQILNFREFHFSYFLVSNTFKQLQVCVISAYLSSLCREVDEFCARSFWSVRCNSMNYLQLIVNQ